MAVNHFNTLNVLLHCTDEDVKRSFRRLALEHHPDKGGQKERFQEINNAYEVLSDPLRRAAHAQAVSSSRASASRCDHTSSARHNRDGDATSADRDYRRNDEDAERASRAQRESRAGRAEARDQRRSAADEGAQEREMRRKEEAAFQEEEKRRQRLQRRQHAKGSGESNAERLHRKCAEREAWKAECRLRRREGEEAARRRAQLNAERRQATAKAPTGPV